MKKLNCLLNNEKQKFIKFFKNMVKFKFKLLMLFRYRNKILNKIKLQCNIKILINVKITLKLLQLIQLANDIIQFLLTKTTMKFYT